MKKRKRYTSAERTRILAAAAEVGLTAKQVAAQYGIHQVTFYCWKRRATPANGVTPPGGASLTRDGLLQQVRREIRHRIRKQLPDIVREEVGAHFGSRSRRTR